MLPQFAFNVAAARALPMLHEPPRNLDDTQRRLAWLFSDKLMLKQQLHEQRLALPCLGRPGRATPGKQ